jgi:hypothetical protein
MKPERTNLVEKYGNASRLKKKVLFASLSPTKNKEKDIDVDYYFSQF